MSDPVSELPVAASNVNVRRALRIAMSQAGLGVGAIDAALIALELIAESAELKRQEVAALESIAASLEVLANAPATGY